MSRYAYTLLGSLLVSLVACAESPAKPGHGLEAVALQGQCALRDASGASSPLDIPWPCELHSTPDGEVRVVTFEGHPIVLLQHSQPEAPPGQGCRTHLQALRLVDGHWEKSLPNANASCPHGQWDEKLYTGMFEQ
ncbi:hypothetical protein [Phytopseudomonas dryadis]|uniref:Lipoprotein n=1 Tax=Phytopseudomonas dryadis TaxID=2487520 RepID=A0A4Q9R6D4_9GAMM|nr:MULTISPECIES: hypothetical protein [Pseudomonas]TBU96090.1 hypothetical protein DNK44_04860 [Pseudomonas dryadis]TBV01095.1 hypothetical protein DNK34_21810 [Pseudomonas dryadis]TBV13805.1 hypothetical protein DNK41_21500 [Pseudomonas sp. FRB 230]